MPRRAPRDRRRHGQPCSAQRPTGVVAQQRKARICGPSGGWARRGSNLRPLACEALLAENKNPALAGNLCRDAAPARKEESGILRCLGVGLGRSIARWPKPHRREGRGWLGSFDDLGYRPVRSEADSSNDPLEDLFLAAAMDGDTSRLLTVADVAAVLRVEAGWVYEHARCLGAFRLGAGSRAPIRFEARTVASRLRTLTHGANFDLQ